MNAHDQNGHAHFRKRRARRFSHGVHVSLTLLTLLALGATVVAMYQARHAVEQRNKAEEQQRISRSNELAAYAMMTLETDPTLSFRLAEAAVQIKPTVNAKMALASTLPFTFHNSLEGHTERITDAVFPPDGARVLTASDDGTARLWDASSGETLGVREGHTKSVRSSVVPTNAAHVATTSDDGTAQLWPAADYKGILKAINENKVRGVIRQLTKEEKTRYGFTDLN